MDQGPTAWAHDIELPEDASSASRARAFVGHHLVEHDQPCLADDIKLVVSELATNALAHAHTPFKVTLAASAHSVLLEVHDGSPCLPVLGTGAPLDTSGRGLAILDLVSIDWGVTVHAEGGKTVWAAFDDRGDLTYAR
jgi:hypothetical protein